MNPPILPLGLVRILCVGRMAVKPAGGDAPIAAPDVGAVSPYGSSITTEAMTGLWSE